MWLEALDCLRALGKGGARGSNVLADGPSVRHMRQHSSGCRGYGGRRRFRRQCETDRVFAGQGTGETRRQVSTQRPAEPRREREPAPNPEYRAVETAKAAAVLCLAACTV